MQEIQAIEKNVLNEYLHCVRRFVCQKRCIIVIDATKQASARVKFKANFYVANIYYEHGKKNYAQKTHNLSYACLVQSKSRIKKCSSL